MKNSKFKETKKGLWVAKSKFLRSVHKETIYHTPKFWNSNLFKPISLVFQLKGQKISRIDLRPA